MNVLPHQGVGDLIFGMSREQVATAMGLAPRRFKPSIYALDEDSFDGLAMSVLYDSDGRCNAVTVSPGGVQWFYDGFPLLAHPASEVRDWARKRDPDLKLKDGFTSTALGLGMWADWLDAPGVDDELRSKPGASFIAFRAGYYEEERARMLAAGLIAP